MGHHTMCACAACEEKDDTRDLARATAAAKFVQLEYEAKKDARAVLDNIEHATAREIRMAQHILRRLLD